ncbi:uncharacterized protein LOC110995485 [Pieris rapae]|uniref:uncharacterized protein LOC110995485 n=1 Tax=Pieris rapae TaxID=64459 RepID=UPI001E27D3A2|nr:uncharacterized protein LOC110995485 [Pieris rapae]XP_045483913.1 uncharacterized protein LOC110995485 [Pieris rapae]XP_045483914.1 uncharacterized protein LOC110995485 [Pieris rapae]
MMLVNDTNSTDDIYCSNTVQLMHLFDLSQPKDIMTIIEVEPDKSNDTSTIKESVDKAKISLSNKRKSVKKCKSKTRKKSDLSIDKEQDTSHIANEFNKVTHQHSRSERAINVETMPYTHHSPASNNTQNRSRVQAAKQKSHQCQMHSKSINWSQITNQSSGTTPHWQTPVRSTDVPNFNQISHETYHGLNVIIEHVFNFLIHDFQNNSGLNQRKLKLFQRCYNYVVNYCLNRDPKNDWNVLNHIVLAVDSIAWNRSQYNNEKQTRLLLSEMFDWCRHRRSIDTIIEPSWPPPYNPPAYYNDPQISTMPPHIPNSVSQKNPNKSSQINNKTTPAVNNYQTCLFTAGTYGKEISINIDTCLLHTLQYNLGTAQTTTQATEHSENIQEKEKSKIIQPPIKSPSVSRHSEFISPPNVNNLELSSVRQISSDEDLTPMITHVTSLNSNASYISRGFCNVCKNETNTRCTGCYKAYYCSRECQLSEWHVHNKLCSGTH